jgi:hypothetical protein
MAIVLTKRATGPSAHHTTSVEVGELAGYVGVACQISAKL